MLLDQEESTRPDFLYGIRTADRVLLFDILPTDESGGFLYANALRWFSLRWDLLLTAVAVLSLIGVMARGFPSSHFRSILLLIALCSRLGFGLGLARAKENHHEASQGNQERAARRRKAQVVSPGGFVLPSFTLAPS